MSLIKEKCRKCGAKLSPGYDFCLSCGTKFSEVAPKTKVRGKKEGSSGTSLATEVSVGGCLQCVECFSVIIFLVIFVSISSFLSL